MNRYDKFQQDKLNGIWKNIEDTFKSTPQILKFIKENAFVAGGAVRDAIDFSQHPNDIDIFFYTKEAAEKFKTLDFSMYESLNTTYMRGFDKFPNGTFKFVNVSVITRYYGSINEILGQFDFNVNQRAITADGEVHVLMSYYYLVQKTSHLVINHNARNAVGTLLRLARFEGMYPGSNIEAANKNLLIFRALQQVAPNLKTLEDVKQIADSGSGKGDLFMIPTAEDVLKQSPMMQRLEELKNENTKNSDNYEYPF